MSEPSHPVYLEVNLPQLKSNLAAIRAHVGPAKVMPMVKANAYGHGVDGVAPFIEPYVDYFGVSSPKEGVRLREIGISKPILVGGGTQFDQIPLFAQHDLTLTGASIELLDAAEEIARTAGKRIKTHLKIDTGMERVGVHEYEAEVLIQKSASCSHLEIEGIYTHLANSEVPDRKFSHLQLERFEEVLDVYRRLGLPVPPLRHMSNSGGILNLPEANFDMVRPGVLFYGVYPGPEVDRVVQVEPALTWHAKVSYSKQVQPGRVVSYGSLWQAEVGTRIVTVPCGYADGYFRRMTNQARVVIRGKKYLQVGRICMDQFMVNVGDEHVHVGEDVVLLGGGITVEDLAGWAGTNEYEVLTSISSRVPRVFIKE